MENSLARRPGLRRLMMAAAVLVIFLGGFSLGTRAADLRLDLAEQQLKGAYALLEAAQPLTNDERAIREFQRHIDRALTLLDRTREQIEAARAASDNPQP